MWYRGNTWRREGGGQKLWKRVRGRWRRWKREVTERGPERRKQGAAKQHEELLDAILQQTESVRIYDERSSNLVEEEVDIEPD